MPEVVVERVVLLHDQHDVVERKRAGVLAARQGRVGHRPRPRSGTPPAALRAPAAVAPPTPASPAMPTADAAAPRPARSTERRLSTGRWVTRRCGRDRPGRPDHRPDPDASGCGGDGTRRCGLLDRHDVLRRRRVRDALVVGPEQRVDDDLLVAPSGRAAKRSEGSGASCRRPAGRGPARSSCRPWRCAARRRGSAPARRRRVSMKRQRRRVVERLAARRSRLG